MKYFCIFVFLIGCSHTQKFSKTTNLNWPLFNKQITQEYSINQSHFGIDLRAPIGTLVKSAQSGIVIYNGRKYSGYGNLIIIENNNIATFYAHLKKSFVKEGQIIKVGDAIALSGNSGNAIGPHLHFEVRYNLKPVDPLIFLSQDVNVVSSR